MPERIAESENAKAAALTIATLHALRQRSSSPGAGGRRPEAKRRSRFSAIAPTRQRHKRRGGRQEIAAVAVGLPLIGERFDRAIKRHSERTRRKTRAAPMT